MGISYKILLRVYLTQERSRLAGVCVGRVCRQGLEEGESCWRNNSIERVSCPLPFSLSCFHPQQQLLAQDRGTAVPAPQGAPPRENLGLSGDKLWRQFIMLAQFYHGKYGLGYFIFVCLPCVFPFIDCSSSAYSDYIQGPQDQAYPAKLASWGAPWGWRRPYCGGGRSPGCSTRADCSSTVAPSPRLQRMVCGNSCLWSNQLGACNDEMCQRCCSCACLVPDGRPTGTQNIQHWKKSGWDTPRHQSACYVSDWHLYSFEKQSQSRFLKQVVWSNSKAGVSWLQAENTEDIPATLQ